MRTVRIEQVKKLSESRIPWDSSKSYQQNIEPFIVNFINVKMNRSVSLISKPTKTVRGTLTPFNLFDVLGMGNSPKATDDIYSIKHTVFTAEGDVEVEVVFYLEVDKSLGINFSLAIKSYHGGRLIDQYLDIL
jgi:hypothetical protein